MKRIIQVKIPNNSDFYEVLTSGYKLLRITRFTSDAQLAREVSFDSLSEEMKNAVIKAIVENEA